MPDYGGNPMDPVKPQKKQAAQDALEALEQAFAYYTPEPLPAVEQADPGEWVIEYYQAA
ncbi:hypothetical protein [Leisingera sp. M523]|uniref:hypothetical protein n=1 Tax=Leisingera sp. M523 TaxID=2867013 RepID=UPI0021A93943|nr:hypothetical protein [Leisingera sp. M523]UWQ31047.1 hypothetical protein K3557_14180 [Leisingera sp. M523]